MTVMFVMHHRVALSIFSTMISFPSPRANDSVPICARNTFFFYNAVDREVCSNSIPLHRTLIQILALIFVLALILAYH